MASPTDRICEVCHERPATRFISYGGTGKSSQFCEACFESSAPPELRQSVAAARDAHCRYCGGQPCIGGSDLLASLTGISQRGYMCAPCTLEYQGFLQRQFSPEAAARPRQEQLELVQKLFAEADTHMKAWVADKGSP